MEKDQPKPLQLSPTLFHTSTNLADEEPAAYAATWASSQYLRKRRCRLLFCCGCLSATAVLLGVASLVLMLTFKVNDPVLTVNGIHVDAGHSFVADISIKNPNVASLRLEALDDSVTELYYKEEKVGVGHVDGGDVAAKRTARMNVTVELENMDEMEKMVALTSYTDVRGKAEVVGIYRRDLNVEVKCSMTLDLSLADLEVKNKACRVRTK